METTTQGDPKQSAARWRWALRGAAALLVLLPLAAMQFTDEVAWGAGDFVLFGAMLLVACAAFEWATRCAHSKTYLAAVGIALATAFVLVWMNLAVGLVGSEDNPANVWIAGVPVVGIAAAVAVRFRPRGMAWAMAATAFAQALVGVIAPLAGWGSAWVLTGLFVALWLASAALFGQAARPLAAAGA